MAEEIRNANDAIRNKRPRAAAVVLNRQNSSKSTEMNGFYCKPKSSLANNDASTATRMNYHSSEWEKPVTKAEFDTARARHDMFTLLIMVSEVNTCSVFCIGLVEVFVV